MIIGIGSDLCDIRRIEKTLARFGQRFVDRVFTEVEQRKSDRRAERAASYAKRFAAKEACAKAFGNRLFPGCVHEGSGGGQSSVGCADVSADQWCPEAFAGPELHPGTRP